MSTIIMEPEIASEESVPATDNQAADNLASRVKEAALSYLNSLGGEEPKQVYDLFLSQMEKPLLEVMLQHNHRNQSITAKQLGLSRGTLRTKMKQHELF